MQAATFALHYTHWHYGRAYSDMYRVWMNLFWFIFNFFSVTTLLSTFLQPFKRMDEGYPKGFDPSGWAQVVIVNVLMRFVGMMMRAIMILFALFLSLLLFLFGIIVFVVWTIMPAFLVAIVVLGMYLLIHG